MVRIQYSKKWLSGHRSGLRKKKSRELRKGMNTQSEKWQKYQGVTNLEEDKQKKWEQSCEVEGLQLWFGKPGKDINKKGKEHDMRPYVTKDKIDPRQSKNKSELYTFPELALEFAQLINRLQGKKNKKKIEDVYRLLARIWRPHTKLDHKKVQSGSTTPDSIKWDPEEDVLARINNIDSKLLELLMITEGIARNEDVCYFRRTKTKDGKKQIDEALGPGRQNNVGTMIQLIDNAVGLDLKNKKILKLWDFLTPRVAAVGCPQKRIIDLCNLPK